MFIQTNFIQDERKFLTSELYVEFKIKGNCYFLVRMNKNVTIQTNFYTGWRENFTIQTNFTPDEQKILPSELKDVKLKIGQVT